MKKCHCNKSVINDNKWDSHVVFIKKKHYARKKAMVKYIHIWLAFGIKHVGEAMYCLFYKCSDGNLDNDHFLAFEKKNIKITIFTGNLDQLKIPPM